MNPKSKDYLPFMNWIIEVAEEKIIEHRILRDKFNSHEEFIIFTIVWLRVYKNIANELSLNKKNENFPTSLDQYIKNFYKNQKNRYLGITINAITRESLIPRSTVKRIIEKLIKKELLERNANRLIIPTSKVRDIMKSYRKYIFKSHKRIFSIFNDFKLASKYDDKDSF